MAKKTDRDDALLKILSTPWSLGIGGKLAVSTEVFEQIQKADTSMKAMEKILARNFIGVRNFLDTMNQLDHRILETMGPLRKTALSPLQHVHSMLLPSGVELSRALRNLTGTAGLVSLPGGFGVPPLQRLVVSNGVFGVNASLARAISNLQDVNIPKNDEDIRNILANAEDVVEETLKDAPQDPKHWFAWLKRNANILSLVVNIVWLSFSCVAETVSPEVVNKFESHVTSEMAPVLRRLTEIEAQMGEQASRMYIVKRPCSIHRKPRSKSTVVNRIHPGEVLWHEDEKCRWIKVEYFDYSDGEVYSGWIRKKYARTVTVSTPSQKSDGTQVQAVESSSDSAETKSDEETSGE